MLDCLLAEGERKWQVGNLEGGKKKYEGEC